MKKVYKKIFFAVLMLLMAISMVVTVSYAWLTISGSPTVNGIQVSIGGGRTILLAPDVSQTLADGSVIHYPGAFSDKLVFSHYEVYDYLSDLGGLLPVSTADGIHWMTPTYYSSSDEEVLGGYAFVGQQKPISDFAVDTVLANANLSKNEIATASGNYLYLDFWIVSPGSEYQIRVTRGEEEDGSFLIELPDPVASPDAFSGFTLADPNGGAGASVRIGFLVNQEVVQDSSMLEYQRSPFFSNQYTHLMGIYPEKNQSLSTSDNRFTIYEPNGTLHTGTSGVENGSYIITNPLKWENGMVDLADVSSILTVQKESTWIPVEDGSDILLERVFQTALTGKNVLSDKAAFSIFYRDYLQGQVAHYLSKGNFVTSTASLYEYAASTGSSIIRPDIIDAMLGTSGTTEDVYITKLERNVPQRIRLFIWIEGQDVDCSLDAALSNFALSLELAGSN